MIPTGRALSLARGSALLYLASVPLQKWPLAVFKGQPLLIPDALLVMTWLLTGLAFLTTRPLRLGPSGILLGSGGLFLAALLMSAVVAQRPSSSFVKLIAFAPMVLAPAMLRWLFADEHGAARAIKSFAVGGVAALLIGAATIVLFYAHGDVARQTLMCGYGALPSGNYPRLCAPFRNPNMFANYLVAAVPLGVAVVHTRVGRWWALAFAAFASAVTVFTLSAGIGALALALALVLGPTVATMRGSAALRALIWSGAVLVETVFVMASLGTFVPRGAGHVSLFSRDYLFWDGSRPSILTADWQTFSSHPLLGIGYGAEVAHVTDPRAFVPADYLGAPHPAAADMEAHNLLFSIGGQAGLVGLATFIVVLWVIVRPLIQSRANGSAVFFRTAAVAAFLGAIVVHGVFIANEEARHFWPFLGIISLLPVLMGTANGGRAGTRPVG